MINAVVFDMDGVLTDSEPVINAAAIAGLREYGIEPVPADFIPFVGTGEDRYIGGVAEKYGLVYVPEMKKRVYEIYLEILPEMLEIFPGVLPCLEMIRGNGTVMAVASSADRIKVEANLKAAGIPLDWFKVIITGEDVGPKKPAPDIYLRAASDLELPPVACCVVEDALNGVQAAKAAGMRCVGVATSFSAAQLLDAGCDCALSGIADVQLSDLGVGI